MACFDELHEFLFKLGDFAGPDFIEESSDTGVDDTGLFFCWHGDLNIIIIL
jgi:hypothetical protein